MWSWQVLRKGLSDAFPTIMRYGGLFLVIFEVMQPGSPDTPTLIVGAGMMGLREILKA